MTKFTHFDESGKARMVDIGDKDVSKRIAIAEGCISMQQDTLDGIIAGTHSKGDVLAIARLAGIMAAKKTADLVPLCHPLSLSSVTIDFEVIKSSCTVMCRAEAKVNNKTGVEMEALTAVQIALLTIYDMCKAVDRGMVITDIMLIEKSGGKSGHWKREKE